MRFDAINRLRKLHAQLGLPGRVQQTPQGAFILVQPLAGNETDAEAALRRLAQEDANAPVHPDGTPHPQADPDAGPGGDGAAP